MKLITPSLEQAQGHYDDLKTKPFYPGLTKFFSSGPVIAMVWQGKGSILTGRKLLGETDPAKSPGQSLIR
jgi:nucleoside-diphosphate kinase